MEDYLTSKPDDFDGIAVKRFLLGPAREQVSWYRQSINALDYVGCVACRRALETGQPFLEHYLPAFNFRDTERAQNTDAIRPFRSCPNSGHDTTLKRGLTMLVKLQTAEYLIYAELDTTERVTHLASRCLINERGRRHLNSQHTDLIRCVNERIPDETVNDLIAIGDLEKQKHLLAGLLYKNQLYGTLSK